MATGGSQSGWLDWFQTQASKAVDYFLDDTQQEQRYVPKGDNAVETETLGQRLSNLFGENQDYVIIGVVILGAFLLLRKK